MRLIKRMLLCLLAVLVPLCAQGQGMHEKKPSAALQVEAAIGYQGVMTYGKTMPLRIRLENLGQDLNATVAVNICTSQLQYDRYEVQVSLAASAVKEMCIPVYVGSKQEAFTVEVWENGEKLCTVNTYPTQVANPSALLVGVLSYAPEKLSYMNIDSTTDDMLRGEYMHTVPLNAETFPDTAELLSSFGMLVVDGFDMNLLNEGQRMALKNWLEEGHILLLGGGAQASVSWPFFAAYTGLAAGGVISADVTSGLLQWLGAVGVPAGKNVTVTTAAGGMPMAQVDGTPLIWRGQAGNSRIYTTSFSLADSVLTGWTPMHSFWQRAFIKDCYSLYQQCLYPSSQNDFVYAAAQLPLENDVPLWPAVLAAAGIMVLGGLAAYILLKRADKRQWLWAVLPGLAAVSAGIVWVVAMGSSAAQPTVLSVSVLRKGVEEPQTLNTSLVIGTPERGEQVITSASGSLHPLDESSYYVESTGEPVTQRYRYLLGESTGLGVNMSRAWDTKYLRLDNLPVPSGGVETFAWMEADGLHASVTNNTQMNLDEGVFLCKYGFCAAPALAPGESCTLALVKTAPDPNDPYLFRNGCMYETMAGSSFHSYSLVTQYWRTRAGVADKPEAPLEGDDSAMIDLMSQVLERSYWDQSYLYSSYYYSSSVNRFFYLATTDDLEAPEISVNGQPVTRCASRGLAVVEVPFAAVQEGRICFLPGECTAVRCQVDAAGAPVYTETQSGSSQSYYHRLNENPVFMFQLMAMPTAVDRLAFYLDYMPRGAQAYLYNGTDWVAYTMGEDAASPQQYMDENGRIFLQLRAEGGVDDYQEVSAPSMALEGRTK